MGLTTGDRLAQVPLFASMSPADREVLAGVFEVQEVRAGLEIVRQGDAGYAFYVVAEGEVEVSRDSTVIRRMGAGEYFGEIAILGQGRRTATVRAIDDTELWVLFGTSFRELQIAQPEVARALQEATLDRMA